LKEPALELLRQGISRVKVAVRIDEVEGIKVKPVCIGDVAADRVEVVEVEVYDAKWMTTSGSMPRSMLPD
jgi:ASC-1-like (ASCH) protein